MKYLRMDLKVCEGCGSLWLRTETSNGVYCHSCALRLADFPAPKGKSRAGRKPGLSRTRCKPSQSPAGGAR
jgi:hypothetical protein